jgi:hypothetical protein
MIHIVKLVSVVMCSLHVCLLLRSWFYVVFAHRCLLLRPWFGCNTAGAIITDMVIIRVSVNDHCSVYISIMYNGSVHIHHGRVVAECIAAPHTASKTIAIIAIAIIDPPIKSYMRSPVACVPPVKAA